MSDNKFLRMKLLLQIKNKKLAVTDRNFCYNMHKTILIKYLFWKL